MRTNIDIDENLLEEYKNLTGFKTKKEAVKQALKYAIKMEKRKKLAALAGKVAWEAMRASPAAPCISTSRS